MTRYSITMTLVLAALGGGCGDDAEPPGGDRDSGSMTGMDAGTMTLPDGRVVPVDSGPTPGVDTGVCVPAIEICGDRRDQNCDGRDTACGDTDMDGVEACREGDDLTRCDCNDASMAVRPPVGSLAGAPEMCDGLDNDCNGRVDEAAACCAACESLGSARDRADICNEAGACVCSTEGLGDAPCPEGQSCCTSGCTNLATDIMNCGFCGAACTNQSDNCSARECRCGSGPPCDLDTMCTGGC